MSKSKIKIPLEDHEPLPSGTVESAETKSESAGHDQEGGAVLNIFLGAGASAAAGYRTFFSFPQLFWPTSSEPAQLNATDNERALLTSIRSELQVKRRPLTVDQYLWILDSYNNVLKGVFADEGLRSKFSDSLLLWARIRELNSVVQGVRRRICSLTVKHYSKPPLESYYFRARQFYDKMLDLHSRIQLFTTNYDLVPEYLFLEDGWFKGHADSRKSEARDQMTHGVTFMNGFPCASPANGQIGENGKLEWHPCNYSGECGSSISVHRLHGCVGWYYDEQPENAKIRFDSNGMDSIAGNDDKENYFQRLCIMYPGKEECVGRNPHGDSFLRLYNAALTSNVLVFVGFAFRDHDVLSAVFNGIYDRCSVPGAKKRKVRIIIIDPILSARDFIERLKRSAFYSPIPLASVSEQLDVRVVRSHFPPEADARNQIKALLQESIYE